MDFSITIEGEKQLSRRLLIVTDGIKDFTEPLRSSGNELQKTFQINMQQEGELFGGWAPRVPRYKDGQRIDTWPLLNRTGKMYDSFYSLVKPDSLILGNRSPYFKYHQSNKPRKKLPRRVMMKIDNQRKSFIMRALQAYIVELQRR